VLKKNFTIQTLPYKTVMEYLFEIRKHKKNAGNVAISKNAIYELVTKAECFEGLFSRFAYSIADVNAIIYNKNVDEFQKINPLLLFNTRDSNITDECSLFMSENLTLEQLQYLPKSTLKRMNKPDIDTLMRRFLELSQSAHYEIYEVIGNEVNELLITEKDSIAQVLQLAYNSQTKAMTVEKNFDLNDEKYQKLGITTQEMLRYVNIGDIFFLQSKNNPDSPFFKLNNSIKVNPKNLRTNYYDIEAFKEMIRAAYHPADEKSGAKTGEIVPSDGIYKASELVAMYGLNLNVPNIYRFIRLGELGYYEFGKRNIRISRFDFEDMLRRKITDKRFMCSPVDKKKIKNKEDYIVVRELISKMYYDNLTEDFLVTNNLIYRKLREECEQYMDDDKVNYFKKSDLNTFLSSVYGVYSHDNEDGFKNIHINFNIDECDELYLVSDWVKELHRLHPSSKVNTLKKIISDGILTGELPVFKLSSRVRLVRKDDLLKIDKLRIYLDR